MKLIAILIIFVVAINFAFPAKSLEFRNKLFDAYNNFIGNASSTISYTNGFSSSTLNEQIKNLESTSAVQKKILEEAQKIIYDTPLRASEGQVPVAEVVLTDPGIVSFTNKARTTNNLKSLSVSAKLNNSAFLKVKDMFAKQYFDHISPSGAGPDSIAKQSGYAYIVIGENLAMGNFKNDQDLVSAWLNSPGHRANILNTRFTEIGTAVLKGFYEGREVWMAVQEFGLPLSSCPNPDSKVKIEIENNDNYLKDLNEELIRLKNEIEETNEESPKYDEKVNEYNDRISSYNELLQATRKLIDKYNEQVKTFNICLQG